MALTQKRRLATMVVIGLAVGATYVAQGLVVAEAISQLLRDRDAGNIPVLAAVAVALSVIRFGLIWLHDAVGARVSVEIAADLRRQLYLKLLALGPGWLARRQTGVVQATLVDGVEAIEKYVRLFLAQILVSILTALVVIGWLISIDLPVGAVTGVFILAAILSPLLVWSILGERLRFWWTIVPELYSDYLDSIQGMVTLKAFGASRHQGERLGARADGVRDAAVALSEGEVKWHLAGGLAAGLAASVGLAVGAFRTIDGAITPAELIIILLLVRESLRPLRDIQLALHASWGGMAASEQIYDLIDSEAPVREVDSPLLPNRAGGAIEFDRVTFAYTPRHRPALTDVSFAVRPGERVAVVGSSGAGKTTLSSLLLRFFDPQKGEIRIDGVPIQRLTLEGLRQQFAIVAQDTYLFHGTIRENLLFAKPDATDAELIEAAKVANAHEFIDALPLGYDTVIGERGMKLSGGERQRLAIARAAVADAPILILDEATSSVDVAGEHAIQAGLAAIARGRTTLVIAHRLSTIIDADRIFVLDRGRLVQEGTHRDLAAQDGRYRSLVAAQEVTV
jgi:ATP-binding cassette subfamily B protein/ATP-binding cassette subfamily C protein